MIDRREFLRSLSHTHLPRHDPGEQPITRYPIDCGRQSVTRFSFGDYCTLFPRPTIGNIRFVRHPQGVNRLALVTKGV
jgi:hypothetical protein